MDQNSDKNHQEFWRLTKLHSLPDFVKNAEVSASNRPLHYTLYADQDERRFPCDDPANTWLSCLYYMHNTSKIPSIKQASIEEKLGKFAKFWNIEHEYDALKQEFKKLSTEGGPSDDDYALVVNYHGSTIKKFPVRNAKSAEKAAEYLFDNRDKYPYDWRKIAAANILEKAASYNANLDSNHEIYLQRAAGHGMTPTKRVSEAILSRIFMLGDNDMAKAAKAQMAELAQAILKLDKMLEPEFLTKTAELLDHIDDAFELRRYYKRGMLTPEECCFGFTVKHASAIGSSYIQLTTGATYKLSDLRKIAKDIFSTALDDDIVEYVCDEDQIDVEKLATVLPTVPRDDASMLEKALTSAGVNSISFKEADESPDSYL